MRLAQLGSRAALSVAVLLFAKEALEYANGLTEQAFDVLTLNGIALSLLISGSCIFYRLV